MTEDEEEVARALEAAEGGDAGHWPTVASILAAEVRRLRAALDRPGELGVLVCSERDGAPAVFRKATSAELRSALGPDPELVKWRKWAGALVGLDFEAIQPFTDGDLRRRVGERVSAGARDLDRFLTVLVSFGLRVEARPCDLGGDAKGFQVNLEAGDQPRIKGYSGFAADFVFDAEGRFVEVFLAE